MLSIDKYILTYPHKMYKLISPVEETVWLSLDEMSALFERDRSVIGKHIRKNYQEGELDEKEHGQKIPDI